MRIVSFLCEYATVDEERLIVVHGAVDTIGPDSPHSIAAIVYISEEETRSPHTVRFELVDATGKRVAKADAESVVFDELLEFEETPSQPPGTIFQVAQAINVPPLDLSPGKYTWRVTVDGLGNDDWNSAFEVPDPSDDD